MNIYALSTGPGVSGVAIVRISGQEASKAIKLLTKKDLPAPRIATLRKINNINTLIYIGEKKDSLEFKQNIDIINILTIDEFVNYKHSSFSIDDIQNYLQENYDYKPFI